MVCVHLCSTSVHFHCASSSSTCWCRLIKTEPKQRAKTTNDYGKCFSFIKYMKMDRKISRGIREWGTQTACSASYRHPCIYAYDLMAELAAGHPNRAGGPLVWVCARVCRSCTHMEYFENDTKLYTIWKKEKQNCRAKPREKLNEMK